MQLIHCPRCRHEFSTPEPKQRPLTKAQAAVLAYITTYIAANGFAPSHHDVSAHFGYRSLATAHEHISNLETKGWLTRRYNEARSIALVSSEPAAEARN